MHGVDRRTYLEALMTDPLPGIRAHVLTLVRNSQIRGTGVGTGIQVLVRTNTSQVNGVFTQVLALLERVL